MKTERLHGSQFNEQNYPFPLSRSRNTRLSPTAIYIGNFWQFNGKPEQKHKL